MLDDLHAHHDVYRAVAERERRQIPPHNGHVRIGGRDVRDRRLVVIQTEYPRCIPTQPVCAVSLAAAGLQHGRTAAPHRYRVIPRLVPAEPVILDRDPGERPLAGQREIVLGDGVSRDERNVVAGQAYWRAAVNRSNAASTSSSGNPGSPGILAASSQRRSAVASSAHGWAANAAVSAGVNASPCTFRLAIEAGLSCAR